MICDVVEVHKYNIYETKKGPFIFTFYEKDRDGTNFELYSYLKSLEKEFNDLPIIRWDYRKFTKCIKKIDVPSPNHLIIIEKNENAQFFDTKNKNEISSILLNVRKKKLSYKINNCKEFQNRRRNKLKPFIINASRYTVPVIKKYLSMNAEMQYKFPNSTAYSFRNKIGHENEKSFKIPGKDAFKHSSLMPEYQSTIKNINPKFHLNSIDSQSNKDIIKIFKLPVIQEKFKNSNLNSLNEFNCLIQNKHDNNSSKLDVINSKIISNRYINKSNLNKKMFKSTLKSENRNKLLCYNLYNHELKISKDNFLFLLKLRKNCCNYKLTEDISASSQNSIQNDTEMRSTIDQIKYQNISDVSNLELNNQPLDLSVKKKNS